MGKPRAKTIPRIRIEESPANDHYLLLSSLIFGAADMAGRAIQAICAEGERFAKKPEGKWYKDLFATEKPWRRERTAELLSRTEAFLEGGGPEVLATWQIVREYLEKLKESRLLMDSFQELFRVKIDVIQGQDPASHQGGQRGGKRSTKGRDPSFFLLGLVSLAKKLLAPFEEPGKVTPVKVGGPQEGLAQGGRSNRKSGRRPSRPSSRRTRLTLLR